MAVETSPTPTNIAPRNGWRIRAATGANSASKPIAGMT